MNHWILLLLLPAAVIMLSSLCSRAERDGELNRTTIVCSTAKGNGSLANCTVPYNNTELVISCDNERGNQTDTRLFRWMKGNCTSGQLLGQGMNYTLNDQGRRLTNDDSATYCCIWNSVPDREYYYIHVNILAPPQLNNVDTCKGVEKSNCTVPGEIELPYSVDAPPIHVIVNFTGNGPFSVQWFHNNTKFDCQNSCSRSNTSTSSTEILPLRKYSSDDGWMISGNYTAVVSNPYGSNSSTAFVRYDCVSPDTDHQKYQAKTLNLREKSNLDYSFCELIGPISFDVVVCLTRNKSDKLDQLLRYTPGNCVQFSDGDCTIPFNNSITKIQVSMYEDRSDYCFPRQHINFLKKHVSLHDDGILILSGYWIKTNINQYCSIRLRVRYNLVRVLVPVAVVSSFLVVVASLLVIIFCKRYYKGRCESRDSARSRELIFADSVDEHRGLLATMSGDDECMQFRSELSPNYASCRAQQPGYVHHPIGSPCSQSLDGNYLLSLEGPVSDVFLHNPEPQP